MIRAWRPSPAELRLIPSAGLRGPVPVLIAIMVFVMMIVGAAGLALAHAAGVIGDGIEHRYTIQIADGAGKAEAAIAAARKAPGVTHAQPVAEQELRHTLEQWLGTDASKADLPLPAIIDVDLATGANPGAIGQAIESAVPGARFVANRDALSPILTSLKGLGWLSLGLVLLIAAASAAAVVLAARGALDTHRGTVEVMHGLGATDEQVAQLFQRQIAVDALAGAAAGAVLAAVLLIAFVVASGLFADLAGGPPLGLADGLWLAVLPLLAVTLATLVARRAVLRALHERL